MKQRVVTAVVDFWRCLSAVKDVALFAPAYVSVLALVYYLRSRRLPAARLANRVEIIAHRGASSAAPENTLASVALAWQMGADAVEVDVHLSKDNRIVAIHDPSTARTSGTDLEVASTTAASLRRLDVGSHKHRRFAGERIPFLQEVMDIVPPGRRLFVEIKCGPDILSALEDVIGHSGKRDQVVIIGFDLDTVRAAKKILPDVPVYWLCDTAFWRPLDRRLVEQARLSGIDGLDVRWFGITRRFVSAVRAAGLDLYAWTVNSPLDAVRLRRLGVDGITTNRPDRFVTHAPAVSFAPC